MAPEIRKLVTFDEETLIEGSKPPPRPGACGGRRCAEPLGRSLCR